MPEFLSDGISIAYEVYGEGMPVLLIHGFGSSGAVNWVGTGWTKALADAGYQAIAIDNRGHGGSEKLYDPSAYHPWTMAGDAVRLLDHLGHSKAAVIGYSMGSRIAAFLCSRHPSRVTRSVWGGMGMSLIEGMSDSDEIIAGLLAASMAEVRGRTARMFRVFADQTGSDHKALAACMVSSRERMLEDEVRGIATPVLIVVGEADEMVGPAEPLAALLPHAQVEIVRNRDHMRTTGDPAFKKVALAFLGADPEHSIGGM